jgi:serine/threonine protein kinase
MDSNYFRLLDASSKAHAHRQRVALEAESPSDKKRRPESTDTPLASHENLPEAAFNYGYYARFFREIKKLGRGYRGSVFLCQHVLDQVALGDYAVKKIAVGDNKQWLVRMLAEVRILENVRHFNIIEYKHCWLEDHRLTQFGIDSEGSIIAIIYM